MSYAVGIIAGIGILAAGGVAPVLAYGYADSLFLHIASFVLMAVLVPLGAITLGRAAQRRENG